MKALSKKLEELSVEAKNAEDRAKKAHKEAKERLDGQRQRIQNETQAALERLNGSLSRASAEVQLRSEQLKSKIMWDFDHLKHRAEERKQKFEAWQAKNYADDKEADAEALVDYAIASVKMAELSVLDAIDARIRAESKAEQMQPTQPMPA